MLERMFQMVFNGFLYVDVVFALHLDGEMFTQSLIKQGK